MMISKRTFNNDPIHLNEGFISDKISSVKEKRELAKSIAKHKNNSKFLRIILDSNNKNIKDLMITKGEFSKYSAYNDIKYVITTIERVGNGVLPQDLSIVLNNVKKGITITEKYEKEFKKAFSTDNELVKLLYLGLTSSILISITACYTKYLVTNKDGKILAISDKDHKISAKKSCVALGEYVAKDTSGELSRIIKDSIKSKNLNESEDVDPIVAGNNGSIGALIDMILDILGKGKYNEKGDGEGSRFDKFLKMLLGYKEVTLSDGSTKQKPSVMRIILFTLLAIIAFIAIARFCISEIFEMRVKMADSLRDAAENLRATAEIEGITAKERDKKLEAAARYEKLAEKIDIDCGVAESKADRELSRLDQVSEKESKEIEKSATGSDVDFGI